MTKPTIVRVGEERWRQAQEFELKFAQEAVGLGDDFNHWWAEAFGAYQAIRGMRLPDVLEVGCGPHTNVRLILPLIDSQRLWLEDPLIESYVRLKDVRRFARIFPTSRPVTAATLQKTRQAVLLPEPLEELSLPDRSIDLVVCINVLDHVRDAELCLRQMQRVLRPRGVLVLGQDLSNAEDLESCPESWTDTGHPIKLDGDFLEGQLAGLTPLFKSILPREQGRNPRCHYGTYLLIARKS